MAYGNCPEHGPYSGDYSTCPQSVHHHAGGVYPTGREPHDAKTTHAERGARDLWMKVPNGAWAHDGVVGLDSKWKALPAAEFAALVARAGEVERLREVLQFYATADAYRESHYGGVRASPILYDKGERARAALDAAGGK